MTRTKLEAEDSDSEGVKKLIDEFENEVKTLPI